MANKTNPNQELKQARKQIEASRRELEASRARQGLEPKPEKQTVKSRLAKNIPEVELTPQQEKRVGRKLVGWIMLVVVIALDLVILLMGPAQMVLQVGTDNPTKAPKLVYVILFTLAEAFMAWMDERDDESARWLIPEGILLIGHLSMVIYNCFILQ